MQMITKAKLGELIHQHMQNAWLDNDPGEKCFDFDVENTARLLNFIDGADDEGVRSHLLECERCRYIYCATSGSR
jgi:hypothetical protein